MNLRLAWALSVALSVALGAALISGCAAVGVSPSAAAGDEAAQGHGADADRLILVTVANPQEMISSRAGSSVAAYDSFPRYVAGASAKALVEALARDYGLKTVTAWPIKSLDVHCVVFEIPATQSRDALLSKLAQDRRVKLAQPMQTFGTLTSGYNDPYFELQRGFNDIDAMAAQRQSRGDGVRVAIIDTGIDTAHPDLMGRVMLQRNLVNDDAGQFAGDRHGTEVAGVIAADANNREGIVGIAPGVRIMALKACWQMPSGTGAQCNSFTLAKALAVAIDADAQLVNMSLGGPADPILTQLVGQAIKRGIVVVAAVPPNGRMDGFPVGINGVIAVDIARDATAVGPSTMGVLRAPGREILTLSPGGHYDFASGSSLSAAHVSGVIALLLAQDSGLTGQAIKDLLDAGGPTGSGDGVNACHALAALKPGNDCTRATASANADAPSSGSGRH